MSNAGSGAGQAGIHTGCLHHGRGSCLSILSKRGGGSKEGHAYRAPQQQTRHCGVCMQDFGSRAKHSRVGQCDTDWCRKSAQGILGLES